MSYRLSYTGAKIDQLLGVVDAGVVPVVGKGINLLDNWYFVYGAAINNDYSNNGTFPVNQRGQQSYTGSGTMIDRWWWWSTTALNITSNGISLNGYVGQKIEPNLSAQLVGKTVTISCLTDTGLITATDVWSATNSLTTPSDTVRIYAGGAIPGFNLNYPLFLISTSVASTIKAAKLELGSVQTLARQVNGQWVLNDPPPYYQLELAKCHRYLRQSFLSSPTEHGWCSCVAGSSNSFPVVNFGEPMASTPSVTFYGAGGTQGAVADWATDANITGVEIIFASPCGFGVKKDGAFTPGNVYYLHYRASAEL